MGSNHTAAQGHQYRIPGLNCLTEFCMAGMTVAGKRYSLSIALALVCMAGFDACAEVNVIVSDVYAELVFQDDKDLKPGESILQHLIQTELQDEEYVAQIKTESPSIEALVLDMRDVEQNNPRPVPLFHAVISGSEPVDFGSAPSQSGLLAALTNRSDTVAHVSVRISRIGLHQEEAKKKLQETLALPFEAFDTYYDLPNMSVVLSPCMMGGIFTPPDIHVCTELFLEVFKQGAIEAMMPILLHELAHSMAYTWELPIINNEDMADEFAAAFLKGSPENLEQYMRWIRIRPRCNWHGTHGIPVEESGESSPAQRAKKIQEIIDNPRPALLRWSKLLAEHVRKPKPREPKIVVPEKPQIHSANN